MFCPLYSNIGKEQHEKHLCNPSSHYGKYREYIPKVSESKYQAGFRMITSGQNPQTFMIPIYSTTVLYDSTTVLYDSPSEQLQGFSKL